VYAELGDVLYIILLVVFVLSGLFKSKKKRADAQKDTLPRDIFVEPEKYEEESEVFDDWIPKVERTAPMTVPPAPEIMEPVVKKVVKKPVPKMSYDTVEDVSKLRIKEKYTNIETIESSETGKSDLLKSIHFDNEEDVKRAFIYSEIFNRKYC
jgi:hypothetical protein